MTGTIKQSIVDSLLISDEPSIRFNVLVTVLGRDTGSDEIKKLQEEIKSSPRVKLILSERREDGRIPYHPYTKWYGAHWVLAALADIWIPIRR